MTLYDALMAGIVVAGMIWGAWRGITWQVASIASLVLGYMVAQPLSGRLAPQFPGEPAVARALAMIVIYAAVSGGVFLVAWIVRATLRRLKFEAFDRHLGMVLGGLEGLMVGLVITLFVVSLAPQTRGPIFASPTGQVVGQVMQAVGPALPGEVRTVLAPFWNPSEGLVTGEPKASVREPAPVPVDRADAPESAVGRPGPGSASGGTTTLQGLIEEGQARVGRAVADAFGKGLQRRSEEDGRAVERR
jgi:membrane protein required for colicin V production